MKTLIRSGFIGFLLVLLISTCCPMEDTPTIDPEPCIIQFTLPRIRIYTSELTDKSEHWLIESSGNRKYFASPKELITDPYTCNNPKFLSFTYKPGMSSARIETDSYDSHIVKTLGIKTKFRVKLVNNWILKTNVGHNGGTEITFEKGALPEGFKSAKELYIQKSGQLHRLSLSKPEEPEKDDYISIKMHWDREYCMFMFYQKFKAAMSFLNDGYYMFAMKHGENNLKCMMKITDRFNTDIFCLLDDDNFRESWGDTASEPQGQPVVQGNAVKNETPKNISTRISQAAVLSKRGVICGLLIVVICIAAYFLYSTDAIGGVNPPSLPAAPSSPVPSPGSGTKARNLRKKRVLPNRKIEPSSRT